MLCIVCKVKGSCPVLRVFFTYCSKYCIKHVAVTTPPSSIRLALTLLCQFALGHD